MRIFAFSFYLLDMQTAHLGDKCRSYGNERACGKAQ